MELFNHSIDMVSVIAYIWDIHRVKVKKMDIQEKFIPQERPPKKSNPLENIMDVEEASILWGLKPSYIKDLCRLRLEKEGKAVKKGKTWILDRNQRNPGKPEHPKNWRARKDKERATD